MNRNLLELVNVLLKDLQCHSTGRSKPRFAIICMIFSDGFLQLLPVLSSPEWVEYEQGNGRYVNVNLLDKVPWASNLLELIKVLRLIQLAFENSDPSSEVCLIRSLSANTVHPTLHPLDQFGIPLKRTRCYGSSLNRNTIVMSISRPWIFAPEQNCR